ncbi:hypothetical protein WI25_12780 [Burkholderia cepacia]|uniref:hypothetical protein n=1 Tax=Burkholderia cepacia TaxID=292 RepID=UPI0007589875|nr:hypothetical protein [Burkholderia cepacia]KUY72584.1 hypothetical protein WI25_12780 [Burkholderia cepacia]
MSLNLESMAEHLMFRFEKKLDAEDQTMADTDLSDPDAMNTAANSMLHRQALLSSFQQIVNEGPGALKKDFDEIR